MLKSSIQLLNITVIIFNFQVVTNNGFLYFWHLLMYEERLHSAVAPGPGYPQNHVRNFIKAGYWSLSFRIVT